MLIDGEEYTDAEVVAAAELYPYSWMLQHDIKTSKGTPFEFEKRKFMKAFLNDMSPLQVLLKPPQIGASETEIVKSLYVAKKIGKDIIYTLPTDGDVQDMAGGKVNRIIAQNPILGDWVKQHDTVEQKQVGDHIIYYRGTWSNKKAMMVSSSLNIHDEVDASDPDVITQYETRLEAEESTENKWRWYFSHPSIAGFGVDIYWQQSDKKEWVITCPSCEHKFFMQWPRNIDRERQAYICHACNAILPDEARINGKWLPTAEGPFSGYHVSQLMLYSKTAKDILDAFDDPRKDEQYFYNYVLGLPYVGSDNKIPSEVVLKNVVNEINEQNDRVIIGVDTGLPIHFTCMNKQGVFYYGTCADPTTGKDPYDQLESFLKRWPNSIIVADQGGDLIGIRKLQAKYLGRVYLVYYRKDRKSLELIQWGEDENNGIVVVDRNRMFQLMVEQLRDIGRIRLNGSLEDWQPWAAHFDNVYRELRTVKNNPGKDVSTNYGAELIWKRNGADHYCFISGTKITTYEGDKNIEDIKIGDKVLTRKGYKRVYDAGLKRKRERVVTAYFSNGSRFTATPDHPLIHKLGKERLDSTTRHAILYSCRNQKVLYTKGLLTDATRTLHDEVTGSILSPMGLLEQKGIKDSINKFGLTLTELFLRGLSFTIKTKIRLITRFLTWCARKEATIKATTYSVDLNSLLIGNETSNTLVAFNLYPMNGGVLKQEKHGTGVMLIKASFWLFPKYLTALSVVLKALHGAIRAVSFAAPDVVIVGLHENIEKKDVINISVEDEHEYFANGILVANCHTLLYALVGLDKYGTALASVIKRTDNFRKGIPMASRSDGTIPGKRFIPKKMIEGYVDF